MQQHPFEISMRSYLSSGELDEAIKVADKLLKLQPKNVGALRVKANFFDVDGKSNKSRPIWLKIMSIVSDPEAAYQLARLSISKNDHNDIVKFGEIALQSRRRDFELRKAVIRSLLQGGNVDQIFRHLELVNDPEPGYIEHLVEQLTSNGHHEQAADISTRFEHAPDQWPALAGFAVQYAQEMESREQHVRAASGYRAALKFSPGHRVAHSGFSRLVREKLLKFREMLNAGETAGAVDLGQEILALNSDHVEVLFEMGRHHFKSGDFDEAALAFGKCARINPNDVRTLLSLGRSQEKAGQYAEAKTTYQRMLARSELDPQISSEVVKSAGNVTRQLLKDATLSVREGDFLKAWQGLESLDGTIPGTDEIKEQIRRLSYRHLRGLFDEASDSMDDHGEWHFNAFPDDIQALEYIALWRMKGRRHGDALIVWQALTRCRKGNARDYLQMARCLEWLKQNKEAILNAKKAIKIDPQLQDAKDIIQRVSLRESR
jgi:tetratricopeptide (TPR) repeat protein